MLNNLFRPLSLINREQSASITVNSATTIDKRDVHVQVDSGKETESLAPHDYSDIPVPTPNACDGLDIYSNAYESGRGVQVKFNFEESSERQRGSSNSSSTMKTANTVSEEPVQRSHEGNTNLREKFESSSQEYREAYEKRMPTEPESSRLALCEGLSPSTEKEGRELIHNAVANKGQNCIETTSVHHKTCPTNLSESTFQDTTRSSKDESDDTPEEDLNGIEYEIRTDNNLERKQLPIPNTTTSLYQETPQSADKREGSKLWKTPKGSDGSSEQMLVYYKGLDPADVGKSLYQQPDLSPNETEAGEIRKDAEKDLDNDRNVTEQTPLELSTGMRSGLSPHNSTNTIESDNLKELLERKEQGNTETIAESNLNQSDEEMRRDPNTDQLQKPVRNDFEFFTPILLRRENMQSIPEDEDESIYTNLASLKDENKDTKYLTPIPVDDAIVQANAAAIECEPMYGNVQYLEEMKKHGEEIEYRESDHAIVDAKVQYNISDLGNPTYDTLEPDAIN